MELTAVLPELPTYSKRFHDRDGRSITIRTVNREYLEEAVQLKYESVLLDYPQVVARYKDKGRYRPKVAAEIRDSLRNRNPIMLVAECDSRVAALIWGYDLPMDKFPELRAYLSRDRANHISYIDELAVAPEFRRRGIASMLLDSYKEIAKRHGVDELLLETLNPDALRLYMEKKRYTPVMDPASDRIVTSKSRYGLYLFLHLNLRR